MWFEMDHTGLECFSTLIPGVIGNKIIVHPVYFFLGVRTLVLRVELFNLVYVSHEPPLGL